MSTPIHIVVVLICNKWSLYFTLTEKKKNKKKWIAKASKIEIKIKMKESIYFRRRESKINIKRVRTAGFLFILASC